jgi:hypothetical protein
VKASHASNPSTDVIGLIAGECLTTVVFGGDEQSGYALDRERYGTGNDRETFRDSRVLGVNTNVVTFGGGGYFLKERARKSPFFSNPVNLVHLV